MLSPVPPFVEPPLLAAESPSEVVVEVSRVVPSLLSRIVTVISQAALLQRSTEFSDMVTDSPTCQPPSFALVSVTTQTPVVEPGFAQVLDAAPSIDSLTITEAQPISSPISIVTITKSSVAPLVGLPGASRTLKLYRLKSPSVLVSARFAAHT